MFSKSVELLISGLFSSLFIENKKIGITLIDYSTGDFFGGEWDLNKGIDLIKTYNINETYVDNIVKEASVRKAKQVLLKSLTTAKDDTAPANITTFMDNKKVTNAVSNNHTMMAVANVDHTDVAVRHIIDIRHNT